MPLAQRRPRPFCDFLATVAKNLGRASFGSHGWNFSCCGLSLISHFGLNSMLEGKSINKIIPRKYDILSAFLTIVRFTPSIILPRCFFRLGAKRGIKRRLQRFPRSRILEIGLAKINHALNGINHGFLLTWNEMIIGRIMPQLENRVLSISHPGRARSTLMAAARLMD